MSQYGGEVISGEASEGEDDDMYGYSSYSAHLMSGVGVGQTVSGEDPELDEPSTIFHDVDRHSSGTSDVEAGGRSRTTSVANSQDAPMTSEDANQDIASSQKQARSIGHTNTSTSSLAQRSSNTGSDTIHTTTDKSHQATPRHAIFTRLGRHEQKLEESVTKAMVGQLATKDVLLQSSAASLVPKVLAVTQDANALTRAANADMAALIALLRRGKQARDQSWLGMIKGATT